MHRPPTKLFLSCLNTLYPAKRNWLFGKDLSVLVSDNKNISKALKPEGKIATAIKKQQHINDKENLEEYVTEGYMPLKSIYQEICGVFSGLDAD